MKYDLDSLSRKELEKLRSDVDKALATLADRERKAAMKAAEDAAKEHGFSLAELTGTPIAKSRGKAKGPAKYRNPENPSQTWTGRGRKPQWIREAEEAGAEISTFEV